MNDEITTDYLDTEKELAFIKQESRNSDIYVKLCRDITNSVLLTPEREVELSKIIIANEDEKKVENAIVELIKGNLRIAYLHANKLYRLITHCHQYVTLPDLILAGNLGLYKAAKKYDYTKSKFSTYAYLIVEQEIRRTIEESLLIHIPINHHPVWRDITAYKEKCGYEPTVKELAENTGHTELAIKLALQSKKFYDVTMLDENENWEELIKNEAENPKVESSDGTTSIMKMFGSCLTPQERRYMEYWLSHPEDSHVTLAKEDGISHQRVSHVLANASRKFYKHLMLKWKEETGFIPKPYSPNQSIKEYEKEYVSNRKKAFEYFMKRL